MKNYKLFPQITLWVLMLLGIIATIMFFAGGSEGSLEVAGDFLDIPRFTDTFLIWCYILLGIVILVTLGILIWEFVKNCKYDLRSAMTSLGVVVGFIVLILVCWFLGSPEKIDIIGYEGTDNVGAMAQMSDAIIYLCYILMAATVATLIWGVCYTKRLK